jgi:S-adenosylmethionine hydrolase
MKLVALLTDFGTRDWYVAALKGVLLSRAPGVRIVDITNEIPPQDIRSGAFVLASAVPWFPRGTVFLAVVDPGVGGRRALLAAQADGRYFVGPDNGLLAVSLARAQRRRIVRLTDRRYWLASVSRTFHGRDILAPVAAYLARGGRLGRLGPSCRAVTPLPVPAVRRRGRTQQGAVIHIDGFGNLITNLPAERLADRRPPVLWYRGRRVPVVSSYADGRAGQLVAVAGSAGFVELAIRERSAARHFRARRGDRVILERR